MISDLAKQHVSHGEARLARAALSGARWIEPEGVPRWRKFAASALIGIAVLIGIAALSLYAYLLWSDSPDFSNSSSSHQFRGDALLYLFLPLILAFGPM